MRIMIINPDWNVGREKMDWETECLSGCVGRETELYMECLTETKVYLDSPVDAVIAAPEILSMAMKAEKNGFDAVVLYCFSDPALEACRQMLSIPVIGAGQTACLAVPQAGYHGTILLADPKRIPEKMVSIARTGLAPERILGFEGVSVKGLDSRTDRKEMIKRLACAGKKALEKQPSQVLVLGCLSFLGMADELEKILQVPVIDPAMIGVATAEMMVRLGLRQSKKAYLRREDATFENS